MDVGTISALSSQNIAQYATQNKKVTGSEMINPVTVNAPDLESKVGDAYSVDISDAAKSAQQTDTTTTRKSFSESELAGLTDEHIKGLSKDQVQALQDELQAHEATMLNLMIQALQDSNDGLQSWLDEGVGFLNFDGTKIATSRFALPEVATNAEDAAKAVADGGDWSVDAVSSRIFDLATAIAGNDPDKLEKMRSAVEEGFKQAGVVWKDKVGQDSMPEITQKTHDEIMSRFDKRAQELSGAE